MQVRLLLKGNQKQGNMHVETEGFLGTEWKKRYFVLKDNLLSWYKNDAKSVSEGIRYFFSGSHRCSGHKANRCYLLRGGSSIRSFQGTPISSPLRVTIFILCLVVYQEECGRENAFQIDTGKVRYNVAAESLEEMKVCVCGVPSVRSVLYDHVSRSG